MGQPVAPADATPRPVVKKGIVSSLELATVLDLNQLPALDDTKFNTLTAAELGAIVPGKVQEAADFYLKALADLGFQPTGDPGSKIVTDDYAQAALARDGYAVSLSVIKGSDPETVMVSAYRHGALDARTLPVSKGGKSLYGSSTSSMFVGQGSVAEETDFLVKALHEKGWQRYEPPHTSQAESPDMQQFNLRNQGYLVSVFVSKAPAQDNKTVVQYQVRTIAHELPAPADARSVEFDDERQILMCEAPGDVVDAEKFYRDAMPKAGFKTLENETPKPNRILLRFEPAEKGIMLVDLTTKDHETTKVKFTWYSAELLAEMHNKSAAANRAKPTPAETPVGEQIYAQDVPLPGEALDVTYAADDQEIKFHSQGDLEPLAKSLIEKLTAAGWKHDAKFSIIKENLGSFEFKKGEASLSATLINIGLGDGTQATISARGLLWKTK